MCQCGAHDQELAGSQLQEPNGAQDTQEKHRGDRPQNDPSNLPNARTQGAVSRADDRLRRHEREKERATLDSAVEVDRPVARKDTDAS